MLFIRIYGRNYPLEGKERASSGLVSANPEFLQCMLSRDTLPRLGFKKGAQIKVFYLDAKNEKVLLDTLESYEMAIRVGTTSGSGVLKLYVDEDL